MSVLPGKARTTVSVLIYSVCSVSMIILNKLILNTYNLPFSNSLLLFQNTSALILVVLAKHLKLLYYPPFSWEIARRWLPLTLLFVSMLYTSMKSLSAMSVSAQTIIKNLAIIFTCLGDKYLNNKSLNGGMFVAFTMMVLGSYLGAKGDPWVTTLGLLWTMANIVATVLYTLYMKALMAEVSSSIGRYAPVFYNNLLSIPFFFLGMLPEFRELATRLHDTNASVYIILPFSSFLSFGMTFAVFWCMECTSPTTFSVAGALNKVPLTFLGIFLFHQFPDTLGYFGIVLALGGGFLYTVCNHGLAQKKNLEVSSSVLKDEKDAV